MEKEIFLKFRAGNKDVIVERKDGMLSFEAKDLEGHPVPLEVEESIECTMYKFNVGNDKCIIAFDNDDICLHIKKDNGIERIFYSVEGDDTQLYSLEHIKEQYENKCYEKIKDIIENFDILLMDLSTVVSPIKMMSINKIKKVFYKIVNNTKSKYMIRLHRCEYIQDIKESNEFAIKVISNMEKDAIDMIYKLIEA